MGFTQSWSFLKALILHASLLKTRRLWLIRTNRGISVYTSALLFCSDFFNLFFNKRELLAGISNALDPVVEATCSCTVTVLATSGRGVQIQAATKGDQD